MISIAPFRGGKRVAGWKDGEYNEFVHWASYELVPGLVSHAGFRTSDHEAYRLLELFPFTRIHQGMGLRIRICRRRSG